MYCMKCTAVFAIIQLYDRDLEDLCRQKLKKKLPINWGTDKCSIKTIYIRDYFKVEGASYTDDLRLRL